MAGAANFKRERVKRIFVVLVCLASTGCMSTKFHVTGNDEYEVSKVSDACAGGFTSFLLEHLEQEAVKFCAVRKKTVVEVSRQAEVGIPFFRCASASLKFRCEKK